MGDRCGRRISHECKWSEPPSSYLVLPPFVTPLDVAVCACNNSPVGLTGWVHRGEPDQPLSRNDLAWAVCLVVCTRHILLLLGSTLFRPDVSQPLWRALEPARDKITLLSRIKSRSLLTSGVSFQASTAHNLKSGSR